jgi:hypothetical protein
MKKTYRIFFFKKAKAKSAFHFLYLATSFCGRANTKGGGFCPSRGALA